MSWPDECNAETGASTHVIGGAAAVLADAAEPASLQQQRSRALQLCSQLQRASLLAQQQQGSGGTWADDSVSGSVQYARSSSGRSSSGTGSSTARTVLALLESNRDVLDQLPKVCCCLTCSAC
jgi:hypothetical protein